MTEIKLILLHRDNKVLQGLKSLFYMNHVYRAPGNNFKAYLRKQGVSAESEHLRTESNANLSCIVLNLKNPRHFELFFNFVQARVELLIELKERAAGSLEQEHLAGRAFDGEEFSAKRLTELADALEGLQSMLREVPDSSTEAQIDSSLLRLKTLQEYKQKLSTQGENINEIKAAAGKRYRRRSARQRAFGLGLVAIAGVAVLALNIAIPIITPITLAAGIGVLSFGGVGSIASDSYNRLINSGEMVAGGYQALMTSIVEIGELYTDYLGRVKAPSANKADEGSPYSSDKIKASLKGSLSSAIPKDEDIPDTNKISDRAPITQGSKSGEKEPLLGASKTSQASPSSPVSKNSQSLFAKGKRWLGTRRKKRKQAKNKLKLN